MPPTPSPMLTGRLPAFDGYDDLEVVERGAPGGGFEADEAHGQDSFAMEDVSEEVRLDPRLNLKAEPATELIDRDALAAMSAADPDDEVITLGPGLDRPVESVRPGGAARNADGATAEVADLLDPAERATLVPGRSGALAAPADTLAIVVPSRPASRTPQPAASRPMPLQGIEEDTGGLLLTGAHPLPEGDEHTRFLQIDRRWPGASTGPGDPSTEVIRRDEIPLEPLFEETVPTSLPTLAEVEAAAFDLPVPTDSGHDELSGPPLTGLDAPLALEPSTTGDTPDALALPPPEPRGFEDSVPIELDPIAPGALMEHTLPLGAAERRGGLSAPPLPSWAAGAPAAAEPAPAPVTADVIAARRASPAPAPAREAPARDKPSADEPTRALAYPPAAERPAAERPAAPGLSREPSETSAPAVTPMVGMLALIGSGSVLAAVVAVAVFVLGGLAILVAWDAGPEQPVEAPLPPIELPDPEPAPVVAPAPEPEPEPPEDDPAPAPRGRRAMPAPEPPPPPPLEAEPVPVAPAPAPAPVRPLPDLEPGEDDDKKRGLFRRKR